jgi:ubiquinone/menaquinone biosynthesis C-methylase UbiE
MDPYSNTDEIDDAILDVVATRLEARGNHPFFQSSLHEYLDTMAIDSAASVLDLGCGTGVASRAIAGRAGFSGAVTGIDLSPYLVARAGQLASDEGMGDRVEFLVGDSRSLELADSQFDAAIAHTLVSHVDDPLAIIREAARLVRSGGMVGIFDGDYASLTFAQDDPDRAKELDELVVGAMITSPRVIRQMPRLLREANLECVAFYPHILAEVGVMDFWQPAAESFRKLLPQAGAMTEEQAAAFADGLFEDSAKGVFFGACNFYSYVAKRS